MLHLCDYDVYIFDCDGVILDSNALKIEAMREALIASGIKLNLAEKCVLYFSQNFGKSRFHHVNTFVRDILSISEEYRESIELEILRNYSYQCESLYMKSDLTPGFLNFIEGLAGKKYVASGSEQSELINVFENRGLNQYFERIYGSPTKKSDLISEIKKQNPKSRFIMFGDAVSDLEASRLNNVDFVFYEPFSNVKKKMDELVVKYNLKKLSQWPVRESVSL